MITAVIPVHNGAPLLARLLDTLAAQTLPVQRTIVVDNASTDDAPDLARSRGCEIISMNSNAGFARAVNAGCRAASTEWVAILNSDVELAPDWAELLTRHASAGSFATGTIFSAQNPSALDGAYDLISRGACAWRAGHGQQLSPAAAQPARIAMAPATALLFRTAAFRELNGFDESFESYLEDVDLGLRCIRAGHSGVYVPAARAWHHGSATFGRWNPRVVRLISRNQLLLVGRHYDRTLFRQCLPNILAGQLLWGVVALRHGAPLAWLKGKLDALRGFHLQGYPSAELAGFLAAAESEIRTRADDPYWRWYFRLTSGRSVAH